MTIKKLTERLTFSCNQKLWQVSRENNISIWPFQFHNAIGSKSLGIRMFLHLYQEEICCQLKKVHMWGVGE